MSAAYPIHQQQFHRWLLTDLGRALTDIETDAVQELLPSIYIPVCVQGGAPAIDMLAAIEGGVKVCVSSLGETSRHDLTVHAACNAMPFQAQSVDLFILPHTLELCSDPHGVLREVNETVVSDGHVVITGFNPRSLWALRARSWGHTPGRAGRLYRAAHLQDWLNLLGFEVRSVRSLLYRPPLAHGRLFRRLAFLEPIGDRWFPMLAGAYLLVARKRAVRAVSQPGVRRSARAFRSRLVHPVMRHRP